MALRQIRPRAANGTVRPEVREARKAYVESIVSKKPPCTHCGVRRTTLTGNSCQRCKSRISYYGHWDSSPPPKLHDMRFETELIEQIVRLNREALAPAIAFCDGLLNAAVSPLQPKIAYILRRLKDRGATAEQVFIAFVAPFAALYLGSKWQGKRKPFVREVKDDSNAAAFAGNLVLTLTPPPSSEFRLFGELRRELARHILANISVLVYRVAKAVKELVDKRKLNDEAMSKIDIKFQTEEEVNHDTPLHRHHRPVHMAVDSPDVKVPLTSEELSRRYPGTYRPLGRFRDRPKYFRRRKDDKADSPEGRKLRKSLDRRGLPLSWAGPLLKLDLSPSKLVQRLRDLEAMTKEIETLNAKAKDLRSQIRTLLRKPNHEPVNSIPFSTDNPESTTSSAADPAGVLSYPPPAPIL